MKVEKFFRIIISISAIFFLSIGLLYTVKAENIKEGTVSSKNGLNVRAEASLKSKIISILKSNTPVELLEESGDWYKIKLSSDYGYIHKKFVTLKPENQDTTAAIKLSVANSKTEPKAAVTEESKQIKGTVLTEKGLNLREEADATSKTIELLKPGTKVEVLETTNIWCKVKVDEYTGYVSKQYLKLQNIAEQTAQTSSNTAASDNKAVQGIVLTENGLNLRTAADFKSKIVSIVKPKTLVNIIEEAGDWYKLKIDKLEGYAFKQFVKIE
jgi:N-acetylmuramoyl-L-alanine amidase